MFWLFKANFAGPEMQDLSVLYLCSIYKLLYFIIIIIIIIIIFIIIIIIITDQFR